MPYNYRYFKKRGRQAGRYLYKNRYNITKEAGNVAKLTRNVAYLMSVLNVERKISDVTYSANVNATGVISANLNLMAQGDTDETRNGLSIKNNALYVRGAMTKHASATNTLVRMIIYIDLQPNGAIPLVTDILQDVDVYSPRENTKKGRFIVLHDKLLPLDDGTPQRTFKVYKKLSGHTYFQGTTASVTDCTKGVIGVLLLSNENTNTPVVEYYSRFRYIDN